MLVNIQVTKSVSAGKKLVNKLVEECTENIDEVKIVGMALFEHGNECICSYTICVVLAVITLTISIEIGAYFTYKYMNRNKETDAEKGSKTTKISNADNNSLFLKHLKITKNFGKKLKSKLK